MDNSINPSFADLRCRRPLRLAVCLLGGAILLLSHAALADMVVLTLDKKTGEPDLFRDNVSITKIAPDDAGVETLYFTDNNGRPQQKALAAIPEIIVIEDTVFTQAEKEFVKNDLAAAGEDYRKTAATTTKDWIKHRCNVRLLIIAGKSGDFVASVQGFVDFSLKDPANAPQHKPDLKTAKKGDLDKAIAAVNGGLNGAKSSAKMVLLPFVAELYRMSGDTAKAQAALDENNRLAANANPTGDGGTQNADARNAEADLVLTNAGKALQAGQFADAIKAINDKRSVFDDADRQSKALYLLADAKAGAANTPDALADAAISYMAVVTHFKSIPGSPAGDALYKTGVIEEKLQKPNEALLTYKQVVGEFKDSQAAKDAAAAVARLEKNH